MPEAQTPTHPEALLRVLVPKVVCAVATRCRKGAVGGVELDGVDRIYLSAIPDSTGQTNTPAGGVSGYCSVWSRGLGTRRPSSQESRA